MKIYVAVPCHAQMITTSTATTLLNLTMAAQNAGHEIKTSFHTGAMIADQRNAITSDFMHSGFEVMLMLDSDQAASVDLLSSMLTFGQPVVGCLYPRRTFVWTDIPEPVSSGSVRDLLYRAQRFVGEPVLSADSQMLVEKGFVEARFVGTGCLVIHRSCIEAMAAHYPELKGKGFNPRDYVSVDPAWNYGLFNTGWSEEDHMLLAEDYSFCKRWREMGGKIFANVEMNTAHIGRYEYDGSYLGFLRAFGPNGTAT